jgi:hypothetical protein
VISDSEAVNDRYHDMRRQGTAHRLAEMLALKQAPALETDTRWLARQERNFDSPASQSLLGSLREAGISSSSGVYQPGLARFPNDPTAVVESRGDCYRLAEERHLTLEGSLNYTPTDFGEEHDWNKPYQVAPEIVDEHYQDAVEAEPALAKKKGFKEELAAKLSGEGSVLNQK